MNIRLLVLVRRNAERRLTGVIFQEGRFRPACFSETRVGTGPAGGAGPATRRMLDLSNPSINHTAIARGFGVDAVRVSTADDLVAALRRGYAEPGPHLIEATVPPLL